MVQAMLRRFGLRVLIFYFQIRVRSSPKANVLTTTTKEKKMRYLKLALLSLMLGAVLALSPNTTNAKATGYCWDCPSMDQWGQFCYPLAACGQFYGECVYDYGNGTFGCPMPYLVQCCTD